MLVSYKWLQTYFDDPLPEPSRLADIITMGFLEVDSMEKKGEGAEADTIFDLKDLADRSPYSLGLRYVAQEVGVLIGKDAKIPSIAEFTESDSTRSLDIAIQEPALCTRYIGRVIEGVDVTASPDWLKKQLEIIGQRSINTIVDLTNYVMLETGQPLHAFDADKVVGNITIRKAKAGEELVILDGSTIKLTESMLVIADEQGPIALAGIKGGKRAEISESTKNIILEAACFNSATVRKTSQVVGIRNDSSKRFENAVTPERSGIAMASVTSHVAKLNPQAKIAHALDVYPNPVGERAIEVSIKKICERLGAEISPEIITDILVRSGIIVSPHSDGDMLILTIPLHRSDLVITEDIADEIGRIYGYDKIAGVAPHVAIVRNPLKNFYYHNLIRKALAELGFSEVLTYSLIDKGDWAVRNPLTVERAVLRNSMLELLPGKFLSNLRNADLLGLKTIRMFEIGKIFGGKKERNALAFGMAWTKLPKGLDPEVELVNIAKHLAEVIGIEPAVFTRLADMKLAKVTGDAQTVAFGMIAELEIDHIIETLPDPVDDAEMPPLADVRFKPISPYPFAARDVAVFVPGIFTDEAKQDDVVLSVIKGALEEKDLALLVRTTLFDVFKKQKEGEEPKTSYAFRLIFQAADRTLTEEEIVGMMKKVTEALGAKGWEVR